MLCKEEYDLGWASKAAMAFEVLYYFKIGF